jgi:hypothetical protein
VFLEQESYKSLKENNNMNSPGREKDKQGDSKSPKLESEKDWENPANPEGTSDSRDKEQLLRQLEEAKRRKDNLTEENN